MKDLEKLYAACLAAAEKDVDAVDEDGFDRQGVKRELALRLPPAQLEQAREKARKRRRR